MTAYASRAGSVGHQYGKAKYSAQQLHALGEAGKAFKNPDGHYSFPVNDREDLENAVRAVGRGPSELHNAIRRFIMRRAAALGLSRLVPASWGKDGTLKVEDTEADPNPSEDGTIGQNNPYGTGGSMGSGDGTGSRSRGLSVVQVRKAGGSQVVTLTGEPIVYETEYVVHDQFGSFVERMATGAARSCTGMDCRLLVNHEGPALARVPGTMALKDTRSALTMRADVDTRQQAAADLVIGIERGTMTQMSAGFIVGSDSWDESMTSRTITRLSELVDCSAVTYPASPTTSIALSRSQQAAWQRREALRRDYEDLQQRKQRARGLPVMTTRQQQAKREYEFLRRQVSPEARANRQALQEAAEKRRAALSRLMKRGLTYRAALAEITGTDARVEYRP